MAGIFIVIEGIDGAGKTTQAKLLVDSLNGRGTKAVYLKEPTNGQWGQKIRQIAANGREGVTLEEELEFFLNDRKDDSSQNILPALKEGKVVVMDRYIHSNMAYQGALGMDVGEILDKNKFFPWPTAVFYLDIKPADGLSRIAGREGGANEGYEKIDFLEKVMEIFSREEFKSMIRIDALKPVEEVQALIEKEVLALIGKG